ncbi:MAG: ADP-ribosylglycohydrolase family protein [Planctomycetes bacterium]|nr:ADP-ribosylglycohydrolase family protein [Planctomycetota bacterium]
MTWDPLQATQFKGCLLGLALGDALGAPHEGGPLERLLWRLLGTTKDGKIRWTDDTQMSLDLAESLCENDRLVPEDVALRFASSYRWSRGYGPGAAKLLKRIRKGQPWQQANRAVFRDGSYGNGGAMRAPVIGMFCAARPKDLPQIAHDSARITHAHPLGLEGALLIASSVAKALNCAAPLEILSSATSVCREQPFLDKLSIAQEWLETGNLPTPSEVAAQLGYGMAAKDSCVTALFLGLAFLDKPFTELLTFVAQTQGDVDTIGAMAGAIWGAVHGAENLPAEKLRTLEQLGRLTSASQALFTAACRDLE